MAKKDKRRKRRSGGGGGGSSSGGGGVMRSMRSGFKQAVGTGPAKGKKTGTSLGSIVTILLVVAALLLLVYRLA